MSRLCATLPLLAATALASDSEAVALVIQKAWRGHAVEDIRRAALQSDLDPWLVLHELLVLGEPLAARTFVGYVAEPEAREELARYLLMPGAQPSTEDVERLQSAHTVRLRGSAHTSVDILSTISTQCNILGVLIEEERGRAYRELGREMPSASHMLRAGDYAHAIGWHARRDYLLRYVVADGTLGPSGQSIDSSFLTGAERSVGKRECLIAYVRVQRTVVAVVVEGGETRFVPLGGADRIVERCAELGRTRGAVGADTARQLLLTPLHIGAGVERMIVVGTGLLSGVPFSAVAPDKQIVYVPVGYPVGRCDDVPGKDILNVREPDDDDLWRGTETVILDGPRGIDEILARCSKRWRCIQFECSYDSTRETLGSALKVEELLMSNPRADLLVFASSHSSRMRMESGYCLLDGMRDVRVGGEDVDKLREATDLFERRLKGQGITPLYLLDRERPQVLVHSWELDKQAGRVVLGTFYDLWKPGVEASEALYRAQAYVRSKEPWAQPRYWAGWQLWGNAKAR